MKTVLAIGKSSATDTVCPKCNIRFDEVVIRGEYGLDTIYCCPKCGMDEKQAEDWIHEYDGFPIYANSEQHSNLCPECGSHGTCVRNENQVRVMMCDRCDSFWRIDDNK